MKTCYILDDQYGKTIYQEMKRYFPDRSFPVQENILNPLDYLDEIVKVSPDYILLDNYFPNRSSGWEEPLGSLFLDELLKKHIKTNIICISDYKEKLMDRYAVRKKGKQRNLVK